MRRRRPESPLSDTEPSSSNEEARHEDADLLRAALQELSALDREIMIARELEGISDRELAFRFAMTLTSVRVRMHRARKRLRALFQERKP
jgi:RNA polymerase sigma-70 factor (ECF subfamily)